MSESKWYVGQTVYVSRKRCTVEKVGRKYFSVDGAQYLIADGSRKDGWGCGVMTASAYHRNERYLEATKTLYTQHGISAQRRNGPGAPTLEQLQRILAILAESDGES